MKEKIRIGCGAGFSGDRFEPSILLAEKGNLDYLVLECLAERTIALAQKRKLADPTKGYDPFLERRITGLLPHLIKNSIKLITNMGAANPIAAAKKIMDIAKSAGVKLKVAAVSGDDILEYSEFLPFRFTNFEIFGTDEKVIHHNLSPILDQDVISANAYLGVEGLLEALKSDADIIITGRVADPSLFLAPMIYEFGWSLNDFDLLGKGTLIGHLMECAGHITGGYFADPSKKPVVGMDLLGHPFADVFNDGTAIISKVEGTGGIVNLQTTKEQLLYEVVNPYEYITPDVIADFTNVKLEEIKKDHVKVTGGTGKQKPDKYKISVGYKAFWQGDGEISYAGPGCFERAKLAGEIVCNRLKNVFDELLIEYIGANSIFHTDLNQISDDGFREIRVRVTGKTKDMAQAYLISEEVEALYTNGPAGGGGVRKYTTEIIGIVSALIERNKILNKVNLFQT